MAVDFESAKDGELIVKGHVSSKKIFKFDSVFSPEEDQGNQLKSFSLFIRKHCLTYSWTEHYLTL